MSGRSSYAEVAFTFVEGCEAAIDVTAVLDGLRKSAGELGLTHFIISELPAPAAELAPFVLMNAWPSGWYERYRDRNYFDCDPVGQQALLSESPFRWRDVLPKLRKAPGADIVMGEAGEFGLVDGYCVPIFTPSHCRAVVALASSHNLELSSQERAAVHLMAVAAHARLRALLGRSASPAPRLTARQREILTWCATGKSAWEISRILNISARTVVAHLESIRRRLNASNTTQAVVMALRCGELDSL
jgi:LuxR family transcriptional regulator, quorum-sensing system regulator BjaR1